MGPSFVRYDAIVETKERSDNDASARAGSCRTLHVCLMRTCDSGIAGVPETMTAEMRRKNTTISRLSKLVDILLRLKIEYPNKVIRERII